MARKLSVGVNWQGKLDFKALIERAKIADDAGIHSIWVAEAWGRDAFTLLTLLAEHTSKIQLAHLDREYLLAHAGRARAAFRHAR